MNRSASRHVRWARRLDQLTVLVLVVLVPVLLIGGMRLRVGAVRLSISSPERLFLLAVLLQVWRHWLMRSPSAWQVARDGLATLVRSEAWRATLPAWLWTRLTVFAVAYLAVTLFGYGSSPQWRVSTNEFLNLPARWDSGWYLGIAQQGYRWDRRVVGQQNVAFFPGYPLALRGLARVFGVRPVALSESATDWHSAAAWEQTKLAWLGAGLSLAGLLTGLLYLFRLTRDRWGPEAASGAVLLAATYPFAVFYNAVYTEALFLAAAVGAFYHFERRELGWAALWGVVAGATRPNGCVLSVPLAVMAVEHALRAVRASPDGPSWRQAVPGLARGLACAAMPGVAMLAFTAYLYQLSGHWFLWLEAHSAWGRTYQAVDQLFGDRFDAIAQEGFYQYSQNAPYEVLNAAPVVMMLLLVPLVWRRLGTASALFLVVNLVPPLASGGFLSMGRVTSVMFPVFIYLGTVLAARQLAVVAACGMAFQGLVAALFFTWRPLF